MTKRTKPSREADTTADSTEKDTSLYVPQGSKIKSPIYLRELRWTDKQKQFLEIASKKNMRVMLIKGPAGSSKSFISVFAALKLLNDKKISDITYLRSAVESSDAHIGFLPGDQSLKMAVYNAPFWDKIDEITERSDREHLIKDNRLATIPINFVRGLNWNAKAIILDEAQNSTRKEIITTLTRLGHFSRCFILADPKQSDLNSRAGGFEEIYGLFNNDKSKEKGIYTFEFSHEDIVRSELVAYICKETEKLVK